MSSNDNLFIDRIVEAIGLRPDELEPLDYLPFPLKPRLSEPHSGAISPKKTVNIMALGDVGANLLFALRLLGGKEISGIGIFDLDEKVSRRYEMEMNQMQLPFEYEAFPKVEVISEADLFSCDVFVFCASKGVPPVISPVDPDGKEGQTASPAPDVRMAQFEANKIIAAHYGKLAAERGFKGLFAVVSDPVDPLCKAVYLAGNSRDDNPGGIAYNKPKLPQSETDSGLRPSQIQGYGLGVMNARAVYYAKRNQKFELFLREGRSFGPHGQDLVIADSLTDYNDELSRELTALARDANLEVRGLGFKPYLAPAVSSAALSLLLTLSGDWHYSSVYLGKGGLGAFMGMKNRFTSGGVEYEREPLPKSLFERIASAYKKLSDII